MYTFFNIEICFVYVYVEFKLDLNELLRYSAF